MLSDASAINDVARESSDNRTFSTLLGTALAIVAPQGNEELSDKATAFDLGETARKAEQFAAGSKAESTRRAYRADLEDFGRWCSVRELCSLPAQPQTLALYLTELAATAKVATLRRRIVAINVAHDERGLDKPSAHRKVREIMRGIANAKGVAPKKKAALTVDLLAEALTTLDTTSLRGIRDKAILLLGFSGAFRRSELAALDVADLKFERRGLSVTLRRSKTDQSGEGRLVAMPSVKTPSRCPVKAVRHWLDAAGIEAGPVFRTVVAKRATADRIDGKTVARLVQRVVGRAGIEGDFSGHSLRAGFVTSGIVAGVAMPDIMSVTGHKSQAVLNGYVRRANVFDNPALTQIMR